MSTTISALAKCAGFHNSADKIYIFSHSDMRPASYPPRQCAKAAKACTQRMTRRDTAETDIPHA
jgi:hypothetical protein